MVHSRNHNHGFILVPAADRRNHFARDGLRCAVARRFADGELAVTAARAARLFEPPLSICERLLEELASDGALRRAPRGTYTLQGRPLAGTHIPAGTR